MALLENHIKKYQITLDHIRKAIKGFQWEKSFENMNERQ